MHYDELGPFGLAGIGTDASTASSAAASMASCTVQDVGDDELAKRLERLTLQAENHRATRFPCKQPQPTQPTQPKPALEVPSGATCERFADYFGEHAECEWEHAERALRGMPVEQME